MQYKLPQLDNRNYADYGFGVRHEVFSPLLGNGILTQEGPVWKHSRELLRHQFVRTQYQNLDCFHEHVNNFVSQLQDSNVNGVIDLQPLFFKLTLDTTTALLFGRSVYSLRPDADLRFKTFAENFDIAQAGLAKRFRLAPWHFLFKPSRFRHACSAVHQFVDDYIEERTANKKTEIETSFFDSFVDQLAQESSNRSMLRDQLLTILLAGRDTTACCLSWTMCV